MIHEHACLRAQAFIADRYGLREVLAPTTEFRAFYDRLGADPLAPCGALEAEGAQLARAAIARLQLKPWAPHICEALVATAAMVATGRSFWPADMLFSRLQEPSARHCSGGFVHRDASTGGHGPECGQCAWRDNGGLCSRFDPVIVTADEPACDGFESDVSCTRCGACCRGGYDSVTIEADDPVRGLHPELVIERSDYLEIKRQGTRCAALTGEQGNFACSIYQARPRCCAELELGSRHCLIARQRVGLSI